MSPINRLAGGAFALGLALTPLASAQVASTAASTTAGGEETYFKAYYLEHEKGDLEGALDLYKSIAADRGASKKLRAAAKKRGTACWEEIASSDFAQLVPEDTIVYVEINRPGAQLSSLLGQLGLLKGSEGSGNVAISPLLIDGLMGVRGGAVAITHVDPTGGPPNGVAILHPGDMDIVRGLIETALPAAGQPTDAIGGYDTYSIEGQVFVTMTERLLVASPDRDQIAGVLKRIGNGGKGSLAKNQDLEATLSMRGDDLLFFCVNAEPVMPMIEGLLGQMAAGEPEMAMAMSLIDVGSMQAIAGRLGVDENGLSIDFGLQLDENHNNVVFNLLRKPHVRKSTLEMIPAGSAFWVASALNDPATMGKGATNSKGEPVVTLMDFGRELFGNVVDVALFAMPGTTEVAGEQIPDIALALTVNDPARSRAIWNLVLGIAKGATGGGSMEPKIQTKGSATIERYDIEGVGLYVMTDGNRLVFTPSKNALEAAMGASRGKNLLKDELYHDVLTGLKESQTMAMGISAGRAAKIAQAYMGEREMQEVAPYLGMVEDMVISLSVEHSTHTVGFSGRIAGLPKVGGMVSQLVAQQLHGGGMGRGFSPVVSAGEPTWAEAESAPAARVEAEQAVRAERAAQYAAAEEHEAAVAPQEAFEQLVAAGKHDAARELVGAVAEQLDDSALELNNFAWYLLTEDRYDGRYDDLALPIAKHANELAGGENWFYLDTLGHALAANGKYEKAIKVESKAIEIATAQGDSQVDSAVEALARFKKMAAKDRV